MKATAVFISLLGHIAVFGIFGFSFGERLPRENFGNVSFWGAILSKSDLASSSSFSSWNVKKQLEEKTSILTLGKTIQKENRLSFGYLRPPLAEALNEDRDFFTPEIIPLPPFTARRKPVIMFYPQLPYQFSLYFRDRQTAHIELMFNIISGGGKNSVAVKRKISSGNLEADLLSMRYISRYLFIQQQGFMPDNWQAVKIDLSAKND